MEVRFLFDTAPVGMAGFVDHEHMREERKVVEAERQSTAPTGIMTLATLSSVRLTPAARIDHPDIGDAIGVVVHDIGDGWVHVAWPGLRSWHKAGDVEMVKS